MKIVVEKSFANVYSAKGRKFQSICHVVFESPTPISARCLNYVPLPHYAQKIALSINISQNNSSCGKIPFSFLFHSCVLSLGEMWNIFRFFRNKTKPKEKTSFSLNKCEVLKQTLVCQKIFVIHCVFTEKETILQKTFSPNLFTHFVCFVFVSLNPPKSADQSLNCPKYADRMLPLLSRF